MPLPQAKAPVEVPKAPIATLPDGAIDAHVHMVAGADFALWDKRVEDPADGNLDDWITRFETHLATLGLTRCLIVHSILYGADNAVTLAAVKRLGADRARAIGLVPDGATPAELDALANAGAVGVRLNYVHGGVLSWDGAKALAPALADRGMHIQMLAMSNRHLAEIAPDLAALPVPVVFDHMCWPDLSLGLNDPGFQTLLRLVGDGTAFVKLSAPYRLCAPMWEQAAPFIETLARANPQGCMWGSDWPHLMLGGAEQPDAGNLLNQFLNIVTDDAARHAILVDTPARLFGFE